MKFLDKKVLCQPEDVWKISDEYRDRWIVALLTRMRVDPEKIDRAQNDPHYSKRSWRASLFYDHGIQVIKHPKKVEIRRYSQDESSILLGEWRNPEIVRVREGKKTYCEVRLDYWQLV